LLIDFHVLIVDFEFLLLMVSANEIHALTCRLHLQFFAFLSRLLISLSFESHLSKLFTNTFFFAGEVGSHFELPTRE